MSKGEFTALCLEWFATLDPDDLDRAEAYLAACADESGGDYRATFETAKEIFESEAR